jgi:hypothetical protein
MFRNEQLEKHLATSSTIKINSAVIAEWNMNIGSNIELLGNYRYRPNDPEFPQYNFISQTFSLNDEENRFYTGATDADVIVDGGVETDGTPLAFVAKKEKERLLYSLEDCFGRFRPRSGINKLRYFENKYSHFSNSEMAERPRYYMATRLDDFKYWTSYRTEDGVERGIALSDLSDNGQNFIQDAAPFVVYKEEVPANRVVIKMQTNVGTVDLGPFVKNNTRIADPFFGPENQTTPVRWRVEYLNNDDTWVEMINFDENSTRPDGSQIIGPDGYVELFYGIVVPDEYRENFSIQSTISNEFLLPTPTNLPSGTAYLVIKNENEPGTVHVVVNNENRETGTYETFEPSYGWFVDDENITSSTFFVKSLVSPPSFLNQSTEEEIYRDFQYLKGLRIVVETMNVRESSFDLIELSPRLAVDLSEKVTSFNVTKPASDLGITGLPVGQLLASVGSISLFDFDQSFFPENEKSIIQKYTSQNIQFKLYEIVLDVDGTDFYIPIKTLYSEGFPDISGSNRSVSLELRDLFFYFESRSAPQIIVQNVSLSYAVSLLLDSIGFSNYIFLRNPGEIEDIIPNFFIQPDDNVAEVLQDLAKSTQTAMFFDESNNLVLMSKGYILPDEDQRETDTVLYGSKDFERFNEVKNIRIKENIANIQDISFRNNEVFNDGVISYETRSIQRSYSSIRQAFLTDRDKFWVYKPVLLWEAEGQENTRSQNDDIENQSAFALTAVPLNSDLTQEIPFVENHEVKNNVIDLGDGIYWTSRFDGYFFANGEIIRYNAIQFSVPGLQEISPDDTNIEGDNVWISNVAEYQSYFSKIPFNGKMYPTGLVRIYTEPNFEVVEGQTRLKNGPVAKHGRGQFGTEIVNHSSGLPARWEAIENRRGCVMDFKYALEESILLGRINEVVLESNNSQGALFSAPDTTAAQLGAYTFREFSSVGEDDEPLDPPTTNLIPKNSKIIFVSKEELARRNSSTFIDFNILEVSSLENIDVGVLVENANSQTTVNVIQDGTRVVSINRVENTVRLSQPILSANFSVPTNVSFFKNGSNFRINRQVEEISTDNLVEIVGDDNAVSVGQSIITLTSLTDVKVGMYIKPRGENPSRSIIQPNTFITAINTRNRRITLSQPVRNYTRNRKIAVSIGKISLDNILLYDLAPDSEVGPAGLDNAVYLNSSASGVVKNIFTNPYTEENENRPRYPATIQSSALVFKGNVVDTRFLQNQLESPKNFISYIYKPLEDRFKHFGTRVRVIGKVENDEFRGQEPEGLDSYFAFENTALGRSPALSGGSGGLAIMVNPETNNGYYFEIAALTENDDNNPIENILFYKLQRNSFADSDSEKAIPVKLFGGIGQIVVDDGTFVGQSRLSVEDIPTVFDLAVEYKDIEGARIFYLYINNVMVGIAEDTDPLPIINNMALFVRGNSKCMFENVYALTENYSQNTTFNLDAPVASAFGEVDVNARNSMLRYSLSGLIQATYLSGIGSLEPPKYKIYYEEFGTIMREAAYFNIRYDKAFPALYAKIAETFNRVKGFTTSGFIASAYGAEFLVFNHTDTVLSLDSSSGNYLRIQGVTFTQQSTNELTVDDYFEKRSNFSDPVKIGDGLVLSPVDEKKYYTDIKLSRATQGVKDFSLDAPYIQSRDSAEIMMEWLVKKIMKPRKSVGVQVFGMPHLQLGDIVEIDFKSLEGVNEIAPTENRFVIYNIEYRRNLSGIDMTIFLSEVS